MRKGAIVEWRGHAGRYQVLRVMFDHTGEGICVLEPLDALEERTEVPLADVSPIEAVDKDQCSILARVVLDCLAASDLRLSAEMFRCKALFKPYQFRPLLKFIKSDGRLLIADETGLGKTIEAAYIILDEILRHGAARIVVACPSHLKSKWRSELWSRFGLSFTVVSGARMVRDMGERERPFRYIVSIDSLKAKSGRLPPPDGPDIDLLVIDEVHNAIGRGGETQRRKTCLLISRRSRKVVGISASPVHLEEDDLYRVIEAIDPGALAYTTFKTEISRTARLNALIAKLGKREIPEQEVSSISEELRELSRASAPIVWSGQGGPKPEALVDMVEDGGWVSGPEERQKLRADLGRLGFLAPFMTRTRRKEVGEERRREVRNLKVKLSEDRKSSILRLEGTTERTVFQEMDALFADGFSHVHRRQLSSSMPAVLELLYNGMEGIKFWNGERTIMVEGSTDEGIRERCRDVAKHLRSLRVDSKWDALHHAIEDLRSSGAARKAIIFTQWLPTYRYLQGRLDDAGYKLFAASGETDDETRACVMRRFQEHDGFCVLLATDVLSEGIDLQTANCVVNYDLPYNPQRIEQRIGRVDRVGQGEPTIHVVNLVTAGSVDEGIFEKLIERTLICSSAVGELPLTITEGIDEADGIDALDAVRKMNEYLDREGIGELESLRDADEALDHDIEPVFQRAAGKEPVWLSFLVSYYISSTFNKSRVSVEAKGGRVIIKGLGPDDLRLLSEVAPADERYYLQQAMASVMHGDVLSLDLVGRDEVGLFTPLAHPLIAGIVNELGSRARSNGRPVAGIPVLHLHTSLGMSLKGREYALVAFNYQGKRLRRRELRLVNQKQGIDDDWVVGMDDLFEGPSMDSMLMLLGLLERNVPAPLIRAIEARYNRWVEEQRTSDERMVLEWSERSGRTGHPDQDRTSGPGSGAATATMAGYEIIAMVEQSDGGLE